MKHHNGGTTKKSIGTRSNISGAHRVRRFLIDFIKKNVIIYYNQMKEGKK